MDFSVDRKFQKNPLKILLLRLNLAIFIFSLVVIPGNFLELFSLNFEAVTKTAQAAVPQTINYQGKLMNSSGVVVSDGTYNMEFKLYTVATSGVAVWTETRESSDKVQVTNGLFSVLLGSVTSISNVNFNQQLYLGVNIGGTSTPSYDGEMSPRKALSSVPTAFVAQTLNGYSDSRFFKTEDVNATSSTSTFFQIMQQGAGKIAEFYGPATSSVLSILSTGRVGVGTTSPVSTFAVNGTSSLGTILPNGSYSLGSGGVYYSSASLGQFGTRWNGIYGKSGYFGTDLTVGAAGDENFTVSSHVINANGAFNISASDGSSQLLTATNDGAGGTVYVNGKLGVGTSSPSDTFTVAGAVNLTSTLKANGNAGTLGQILQSTGSGLQWTSTSSLGLLSSSVTTSLTNGFISRWNGTSFANSIVRDNGTVAGINATSSSYTFNVQGNAGTAAFNVASSTGTSLFNIANDGTATFSGNAIALNFSTSNRVTASNFAISGSFLYGQSTLGSGFKLTDGSGTTMTGGGLEIFNAYTNTSNYERGSINWNNNVFEVGVTALGSGTNRNLLLKGASVNVGSSTASTAQLFVQGTSSNPTAGLFAVASSTGASVFSVLANGNVGIGNAAPTSPLVISRNGNTVFSVSATGVLSLDGYSGGGTTNFTVGSTDGSYSAILGSQGATNAFQFRGGYGTLAENSYIISSGVVGWGSAAFGNQPGSGADVLLTRDAAGVLALRNGQNAQTFRVYNGYGSASNYERGTFGFAGNVLTIGTENSGTGTARSLAFATASTTRMVIDTSGNVGIGSSTPSGKLDVGGNIYATGAIKSDSSLVLGLSGSNPGTTGFWSSSGYLVTNIGPSNGLLYKTADGSTDLMIMSVTGKVGISTTSIAEALTVGGNINLTGSLKTNGNAGTLGQVLQTTGTGLQWVATSSLGISSLSGGTNGYVARWTGASSLSSGLFLDNGTVAGINATTSTTTFNIRGTAGTNPFNIASSSGSDLFTINQLGNVHLGVSDPASGTNGVSKFKLVSDNTGASSTATSGLALVAGTLASAGTQQASPMLRLIGSGWETLDPAALPVAFNLFTVPVLGGAIPSGYLAIQSQISNGAANTRLVITSGGAVGIGTTSPTTVLAVAGTMTATGVSTFGSTVGIGTSSPAARLSIVGSAATSAFIVASSSGSKQFEINPSGAFLIGNDAGTLGYVLQSIGSTGAPVWVSTSSLGISGGSLSGGTNGYLARWTGASSLSTGLLLDNGTVAGVNATSSTTTFNVRGSGSLNAFNVASSTGENIFTVSSNGRVGVGTTTPFATFTVVGATGSGPKPDAFAVFGGPGSDYGSNISLRAGYANAGGYGGSILLAGGDGGDSYGGNINIYAGSSTATGGTGGDISIIAGGGSTFGTGGNVTINTGIGDSSIYGNIKLVTTGGNVGIGTTSPTDKLSITGSVNITGALKANSNPGTFGQLLQSTATGLRWVATSSLGISGGSLSGGTDGYVARWTSASTLSSGLFIDNGTVAGVGATSSTSFFNIAGTTTARNIIPAGSYTGNVSSYSLGASTTRWASLWADVVNVGSSTWSLVNTGANKRLGFFNQAQGGGTEALSLTPDGQLGIGVINPQATLDVSGNIKFGTITEGYGFLNSGSLGQEVGLMGDADDFIAVRNNFDGGYYYGNSALVVSSGGNVGIGSTTPAYKLTVNGALGFDGVGVSSIMPGANRLTFGEVGSAPPSETGMVTTFSSGGFGRSVFAITDAGVNTSYFGLDEDQFTIGSEGSTDIIFRNGMDYGSANILGSGAELFRIEGSTGFIGVGTSSPSHRLTVDGDVNITGSFYQNGVAFGGGSQWITSGSNIYFNTGTVAIGTTPSADYPLVLAGGNSNYRPLQVQTNNVNGGYVEWYDTYYGTERGRIGYGPNLNGGNPATSTDFGINSMTGGLAFITNNAGTKMYIDPTGFIGIGTTDPSALLSLGNGLDPQKLLLYDNGDNDKFGFGIQPYELRMFAPSNNHISFGGIDPSDGTTFTELMRVDNISGNVGIGTTTAGENLTLVGTSRFTGASVFQNTVTINGDTIFLGNHSFAGNVIGGESSFWSVDAGSNRVGLVKPAGQFGQFAYATGAPFIISQSDQTDINPQTSTFTPRLVVEDGGFVGINTLNPAALLSLGNGTDAQKVLLYDDNSTSKYGFGIQAFEMRQFVPTDGHFSFGSINTGDGTTFAESVRIDGSTGNVGIGTTTPDYELTVDGVASITTLKVGRSTTIPDAAVNIGGSKNGYFQANIQNLSSGNAASTDFVATADNGTDSTYYIDLGINGSGYNQAAYNIGGANDGYLYTSDGGLSIGTASSTNTSAVIKFHTAGTTVNQERMRIDTNGNVQIGTTSANTTERLTVEGGNIRIGGRSDVVPTWQKRTHTTAGTITSGGTANIGSTTASAVFNGSLYIGTTNANGAEIYRYNGNSTWTKVSQTTAGTIASGGTANIDGIASMAVWSGQLYVGTREASAAEVYRYDGGTTWTKVSSTTAGAVGGVSTTTAINSISSMAVNGGFLYVGTSKSNAAEVYRYNGAMPVAIQSWSKVSTITGTAGTIGASTNVDAVTALASFQGYLYAGTTEGTTAALYRYDGQGTTATGFTVVGTAGTFSGTGPLGPSTVTGIGAIRSMAVYNGKLYLGIDPNTSANAARVVKWDGMPVAGGNYELVSSSTAGTIAEDANSTASIDQVTSMAIYHDDLYIGTMEPGGSAEVYKLDEGGLWTKVSHPTAGTIAGGGTASISGIYTMSVYNDELWVGTSKASAAEAYGLTLIEGASYALQFEAASDDANGIQNGFKNYGSIEFQAEETAFNNTGNQTTGKFVFSHGLNTVSGAYDLAEDYPTRDETLQPGDVVSIDTIEKGLVKKSQGKNDQNVIGVYSKNPALRLSQKDPTIDGAKAVPIALAGRVPVNVTLENGPIAIGDYITVSNSPGKAAKATKPGRVLGRALSAYNGVEGEEPQVTVFIGVETIGWNEIQQARTDVENIGDELSNEEPSTVGEFAQAITDAISDIAFTLLNKADNVVAVITNKLTAIVANISNLFVKDATVLPDGSISVPRGQDQIAGSGVIAAGETNVVITNKQISEDSLISVTPTASAATPLYVTDIVPGVSFMVRMSQAEDHDVTFNWFVVRTYVPIGTEDDAATSTVSDPVGTSTITNITTEGDVISTPVDSEESDQGNLDAGSASSTSTGTGLEDGQSSGSSGGGGSLSGGSDSSSDSHIDEDNLGNENPDSENNENSEGGNSGDESVTPPADDPAPSPENTSSDNSGENSGESSSGGDQSTNSSGSDGGGDGSGGSSSES